MTATSDHTDARPFNFIERQKEGALAQIREQQAEFARVADIVLPKPASGGLRNTTRRVSDVITIGADHLVEVTDRHKGVEEVTWTTVVGDKRSIHYFHKQDEALLHLIARRHDDNENGSSDAAFYAGRVLGVPA
jgi:hypothetical protein